MKKALLVVDVQNDFCSRGALAVKEADSIIPVINKYIELFEKKSLPIFASRDWHPKETTHFKDFGGPWPTHCVMDTFGAEFNCRLKLTSKTVIISKGIDKEKDSYSDFQAFTGGGEAFLDVLKRFNIDELFVCGIATDYCVKASVIDALRYGFKVNVLVDAVKAVNLSSDDGEKALDEMNKSGAVSLTFERVGKIISD